ncbi:hypothetical protein NL445_27810, partial [Klebsiella pneumoniae]|nr:hypothetical protein [Klebsiella pneumoniae]
MDFTDDPFKDYRYEDPFNIEDPFSDAKRPVSVAGFETDEPFARVPSPRPSPAPPRLPSGRVSAPPVVRNHNNNNNNNDAWPAWPDEGGTRSAWPADADWK